MPVTTPRSPDTANVSWGIKSPPLRTTALEGVRMMGLEKLSLRQVLAQLQQCNCYPGHWGSLRFSQSICFGWCSDSEAEMGMHSDMTYKEPREEGLGVERRYTAMQLWWRPRLAPGGVLELGWPCRTVPNWGKSIRPLHPTPTRHWEWAAPREEA